MINEYDIVIALKPLGDKIKKGDEGTVLMVYPSKPVEYEVEFLDNEGETLDILTVKAKDIKKIEDKPDDD